VRKQITEFKQRDEVKFATIANGEIPYFGLLHVGALWKTDRESGNEFDG